MKTILDLLDFLYKIDVTHIKITEIVKAFIFFFFSIFFYYVTRAIYFLFPEYFPFLIIPLAILAFYPAYSGIIAMREAFKKGEDKYLVYATDDGLRRKKI